MPSILYLQIQEDMKTAMRAKDAARLGTIRLLLAAIKQREIDERITLNDQQLLATIDKMIKQRNESITQYRQGNRQDLVDKEEAEITVLKKYLPQALTENEIEQIINEAINTTNASSIKDMAKAMAYIKDKAQGRADMGMISAKVKTKLS